MNRVLHHVRFILGTLWAIGFFCDVAAAADLFNPNTQASLVSDRRAAHAGDLVTVLITENSSASDSANSTAAKNFGLGGLFSSAKGNQEGGNASVNNNFAGQGRVERTGRVLAQISVVVQNVLPNGDLVVAGHQAIDINGEKTNIRVTGRVRPIDIADNNTVPSTRLADATIGYEGQGYMTDNTKPGLIPRVLNWIGLW